MKTKTNKVMTILIILVILLLFVLLGAAFMLKKTKEQKPTVSPQVHYGEESITIEDQAGEDITVIKEGIFKKKNSSKQKRANTDRKGGSETLEIIEQEDDKDTNGDTDEALEYDMLPGIW